MTRLYSIASALDVVPLGLTTSWSGLASSMWRNGLHGENADLTAWSLWVKGPFYDLESDLTIVDISDSLKLVEYKGFIKVLTPGGVVDLKMNSNEPGKRRFMFGGLEIETLRVLERVCTFYYARMSTSEHETAAVGFRAWLALDDSTPYEAWRHDPDGYHWQAFVNCAWVF